VNNNSALGAIWRRWWLILLLAGLGAVLAALPDTDRVEAEVVRSYEATHTMLVNNPDSTSNATGSAVSPSQVSLLATVGEVPERVREQIEFSGNAAELARQITVAFDFQTGSLTFTSTQPTPEQAERIANAFAEQTNGYLAERQDVVYQERLASALERLETLETQLDDLTLQLGDDPSDPTLQAQRDAVSRQYSVAFEQAQALESSPPTLAFTTLQNAQAVDVTTTTGISTPTSRPVRAAMGGAAGFAVGIGAALLLSRLDRRIRTRELAEDIFGMRARVTIPKTNDRERDRVVVSKGRHDPLADSYRTLRNVVSFVQAARGGGDGRAPVTLVVSPGPGDGKTSAAANLAAAFAETGARTVIANTDFRRPRLAAAVRRDPPMLMPFEADEVELLDAAALAQDTDTEELTLLDLSSVEGTAGELSRATARLVPQLTELADQVVIDSSPVGATAEVLDMVPLADVIVVVGRVGQTSIDAATRAMSILRDLTNVPMVLALHGLKHERTAYYEYTDRRRVNGEKVRLRERFRRTRQPVG
jgi:Mrp family chromosome partitioning ATPase/capsular polysaccharide biosynthesis protein